MDFFVEITTKEKVLANADFITLHLPYDKKQGPIIGKKEFDMMKQGVVIVNCARGGVVDEAALLDALNSGKVAGAGLDVFMNEAVRQDKEAGFGAFAVTEFHCRTAQGGDKTFEVLLIGVKVSCDAHGFSSIPSRF